jgi:hypothetical protein
LSPIKNLANPRVDFSIRIISSNIFKTIFNGRHSQDKRQGYPRYFFGISSNGWYQVDDQNEKKVNVSKAMELLEEIFRDEVQYGVFVGVYGVRAG